MARTRSAAGFVELGLHFEPGERIVPRLLENFGQRTEGFPARAVVTVAALGARVDEAGVEQRLQLQRDRAEGDIRHRAVNVARGALLVPDQAEDLAAAGRSGSGESGRRHVYTLVTTKI